MKNIKKYSIYIIVFIFVIFIIPVICTKKVANVFSNSNSVIEKENFNEEKYKYNNFEKIKLLHSKENETIEELQLDEYLYGVVAAEMPADYEIEALKAQAVAARTYTIYKIINSSGKHQNADICDDSTCCQAWISKEERMNKWEEEEKEKNWNKIVLAVDSTAGKIITYKAEPINAFFHSNSGGITEVVSEVWGGRDLPYLKSVETSGEENYNQYNSEAELSKKELVELLKKEYKDLDINFEEKDCIKILKYTSSNRVKTVKFGNTEIPGVKVRSLLGLKSNKFSIEIKEDSIVFYVIGYGHGVGLSQTGADSLAKMGVLYQDILKHFYDGVEISDL